jgi:hypothetical protein
MFYLHYILNSRQTNISNKLKKWINSKLKMNLINNNKCIELKN